MVRTEKPLRSRGMMRTLSWGALGLTALAFSVSAEAADKQDPNQQAAQAARTVEHRAEQVAAYAGDVADHYSPETAATQAAAPQALKKGLRDARNGVVTIEREGKVLGVGTVLAGDGRILTALSNVGHGNQLDVRFADGSVSRVRVGHTDRAWDLALLVPQNGRWQKGLRASSETAQNQGASARMYSLQDKNLRLSRAILKNKRTLMGGDSELLQDAVEIGSNLRESDVGGPMLDGKGDVVAMVARACAPQADGQSCVPTPYAVPVTALRAFLRTVPPSAVPPAPWLGIKGKAEQVGPVRGVRLLGVDSQSPAAAAGLHGGSNAAQSDVVVAVDGKPVTTPEQLSAEVNERAVGDSIRLLVYGNGQFREVSMTLRAAPGTGPTRAIAEQPAAPQPKPRVRVVQTPR